MVLCAVIDHPTTTPGNGSVTAFVLVGPPASGKTTVRSLFEDHGAVGRDLAPLRDTPGAPLDDDTAVAIAHTIAEARSSDTPVACFEGAISETEIERVRELATTTLVVRIRVPDTTARLTRYVDRELAYSAGEAVPVDRRAAVRMYAQARAETERPYPTHAVSLVNGTETSVTALFSRVGQLLEALTSASVSETPPSSTDTTPGQSELPELSALVETAELDPDTIAAIPDQLEQLPLGEQ